MPTDKGHGIQIMENCAAFSAAGHQVTLAVSSWLSADEATIFTYYGVSRNFRIVKVPGVGLVPWGTIGFIIRSVIFSMNVKRTLDLRGYDVIYTRDDVLVKRGFIYEMHDVRKGYFQRRALRRAGGIVVITRGLADYCWKAGVAEDDIVVAPDGVRLEDFDISGDKMELRKKTGLPKDKNIVLYAGHLYSWKGADVLAQAAASLDKNTLVVFVGGNGPDLAAFKLRFGSDSHIFMAGWQPYQKLPYYFKAADVLVLPNSAKDDISRLYTSPIKLFQYMASGVPIVASDLPSIREILDESNAIFARPDDPSDLAQKISMLVGDLALGGRLAAKAAEDVQLYSWSARASNILGFIDGRGSKKKDTAFYDKASDTYSGIRYPEKSTDYNHFFFKRRLDVTVAALKGIISDMKPRHPSLLEVGCADGVVLRRVSDVFGNAISTYAGVDISPKMIESAKAKNAGVPLTFSVRDPKECFAAADIVIEIGVLNYADFDREMGCAEQALPVDGRYICSVAGRGSLWDRLVRVDKGFGNFLTYREYENKIRQRFDIVSIHSVGLRLPIVWRAPVIARLIQPVVEACLALLAPNSFHEKVYVLRLKP